jgi:hypothetical protein
MKIGNRRKSAANKHLENNGVMAMAENYRNYKKRRQLSWRESRRRNSISMAKRRQLAKALAMAWRLWRHLSANEKRNGENVSKKTQ